MVSLWLVSTGSSGHVNFIILLAVFTALLHISPLGTDSAEHQTSLKQLIAFKLYVSTSAANISFSFGRWFKVAWQTASVKVLREGRKWTELERQVC